MVYIEKSFRVIDGIAREKKKNECAYIQQQHSCHKKDINRTKSKTDKNYRSKFEPSNCRQFELLTE
jgi:hypothetical protein